MKKIILIVVILSLSCGIIFSQDNDDRPGNNIALHATLIGIALNYEMCFNSHLSLLADTSLNIFPATFTIAAKGRLYPFGRTFYLEMGAGYGVTVGYMGMVAAVLVRTITLGFYGIEDKVWLNGLVLTPALGWKIDFGKPGGLTLPISLGIDFFAGFREELPVDFVPNIRIGVGYSF